MTTFIALLCGINVGGNRKVPMSELCALGDSVGLAATRSYIQSGNLVFCSSATAGGVEAKLEAAILARFGFAVDVLVRTARQWEACAADNPFPEASEVEPSRVMLLVSKAAPSPDAAAALQSRASGGERVVGVGGVIWVHYPAGVGSSKLTPALVDRLVGSKVTARNWRTVVKLREMAGDGR
jgi:uncharacterized protein (DUF1697 family)